MLNRQVCLDLHLTDVMKNRSFLLENPTGTISSGAAAAKDS